MNLIPPIHDALRRKYQANPERTAELIAVIQNQATLPDRRSEAVGELYMANVRLIARTVAEFSPVRLGHGIPEDDLLQEAYFAVEGALRVYDPQKGALSTLLVKSVRTHLKRHIENKGYEIRIPVAQHGRLRRITYARESGRAGHSHAFDRRTVAQIAGLTEAQVRYVEQLPRVSLSLDDRIGPDDARVVSEHVRVDSNTFDPIVLLDHDALDILLAQALDSRTLGMVRDVYGLNARREPLTASEVARKRRTTTARVSLAVKAAIRVLQSPYYLGEINRLLGQAEPVDEEDRYADPDVN